MKVCARLGLPLRGLVALSILSGFALGACARKEPSSSRADSSTAAGSSARNAAAVAPGATNGPPRSPSTPSSVDPAAPEALPALEFVEDDHPRALTLAKQRNVPLFVDGWAPWCHTCLSLREFVLDDPRLRRFAKRFVFSAIDTEKDENRAFVDKYPQKNWPTLWIIDAATEAPLLKWVGALTVSELESLLDGLGASADRTTGGEARVLFGRGQTHAAQGRLEEALKDYEAALAAAPKAWPDRAFLVDALLPRLSAAGRHRECAELALREAKDLPSGSARADILGWGLRSALELPKPQREPMLMGLLTLSERVLGDPSASMLADDRSMLYEALVEAYGGAGRAADQTRAAEAWARFLEGQAARATDARGRAVFDSHRLTAYLTLERPEAAAKMLAERERELPEDYNPPARLAKAYLEMKHLPEAEAAIDRALGKAYGPRKLRLYLLKHEIQTARDRTADARKTLEEAVAHGKDLSFPGSYAAVYDELKALLARASGVKDAKAR